MLFLLLQLILGYDIYEDEYQNQHLPGSVTDPRALPNSPFDVDTNRLSDGLSTRSILTTTSPAFPRYRDLLYDPSYRRQHYLAIKASETLQGIADSSAGELTRDAALANLMATRFANGSTPPRPNTTFAVQADSHWNPSGFAMQKGQRYRIDVQGSQFWMDGRIKVNAEGYTSYYDATSKCYAAAGRCRPYLMYSRRILSANWMSLCCGIGNYVWKLQEASFGMERYMPMNENEFLDTLFHVGSNTTFTAQATGELVCFANDALGLYWNNQGHINVTITLLTWPPIKAII